MRLPIKTIRYVSLSLFFVLSLFVFIYLLFPISILKPYLIQQAETALSAGSMGSNAGNAQVNLGHLGLWRLSGVKLSKLSIQLPSYTEQMSSAYELDWLGIRLGIWGLLRGKKSIGFSGKGYDGRFSGKVVLDKTQKLERAYFSLSNLNVGGLPPIRSLGAPSVGTLAADVDLLMGKEASKNASGTAELSLKGFSIGPGEVKLPSLMFSSGLTVPKIRLGDLQGKLQFTNGKGVGKNLKLTGGDIDASLDIDVMVSDQIGYSRLEGTGWFKIRQAFLDQNPKFKTLLELSGTSKPDQDGKYEFTLRGTLSHPLLAMKSSYVPPPMPPQGDGLDGFDDFDDDDFDF